MEVPFLDVLSEMCDDKLPLTTVEYEEWGNPNNKEYYNYIKKYSPYQNVDLKKEYPNIYITSYINDSMVNYKVPLRYYEKIIESDVYKRGDKKIFLDINLEYGHKGSSKENERIDEDLDINTIILGIN